MRCRRGDPSAEQQKFAFVALRARPEHKKYHPMHVTLRAAKGLPSFRNEALFAAFDRAVRMTRRTDFRIVEFSVQANHLHLIVEADDNEALANGMKSFSVRANRLFNVALGRRRGRVWGDRYHRRDLMSPRQVRNAIVYCLANFKKHQNIAEGAMVIDPFSSAKWFEGWSLERTQSNDRPRPTERAGTMLLKRIWMKHGLIHPGERPVAPG